MNHQTTAVDLVDALHPDSSVWQQSAAQLREEGYAADFVAEVERRRADAPCPGCEARGDWPGWQSLPPSDFDVRVGESRRQHRPCPVCTDRDALASGGFEGDDTGNDRDSLARGGFDA